MKILPNSPVCTHIRELSLKVAHARDEQAGAQVWPVVFLALQFTRSLHFGRKATRNSTSKGASLRTIASVILQCTKLARPVCHA
eukprot:6207275-Pleurochrysis_carterae.AAC.1